MKSFPLKIAGFGLVSLLGIAGAQTGQYLPANIANTPTALLAHQIQGEYYGLVQNGATVDTLGAWVVANANNSYTVSLLPGGLVKIPGQPGGNWGGTLRYTGTGTWNSTTNAFVVTTASGYASTGAARPWGSNRRPRGAPRFPGSTARPRPRTRTPSFPNGCRTTRHPS